MPFIRVRGATPGDPLHEFDVDVAEVQRNPGLYHVIDDEPVAQPRPALHVPGVVAPDRDPEGDEPKPRRRKQA